MTARSGARNRAIWIVLAIWLALLSATGAESQSNDHELRRRRPELQRGQREAQIRKSTQSSALQSEAEELLEYGDELRSQILETLGKLVYDHYDELNLEQLETLYRVYRNTLERKYNIFETASSLRWRSEHLRASDICQAVDGNVCTCIRNSSQVCASLELLDKRRSAGGGGATDLAESVDKYFPEGLTLQALLRRLRKGDLRITPKLLVGLLRNVQYDSFDNTVRRIERIVIEHLETLRDSGLPYQLNDYSKIKSVASLLRTLLQGNAERFPAREKRAALMLADHVERDVNSISENIENFGSIYENRKINLKYLFELVVPDDLVDTDIVKARNRLEEVMDENDVPMKLSIEKYEHADPAQLMLEILRQMKYVPKTISFPKNAVKALRMHADFWRKGYTIDNVSDFLKLFSAYDNLMDHPNYTDFFDLIESIKVKLANSRNVDLELTCTMPRPCLRRVLLKILECNMIDDDTKKTVLKFLNMINSRGTPLLEEKQSNNFEDYTPLEVTEKYVDLTTEQSTVTTVPPNLDVPTETKTTAAYSTKSTPKHILKTPAEPLDKAKKSKPSAKRTPTNERGTHTPKIIGEFSPEKADKNKIPVGNLKKKNPKKEIDPNERIKKKRKPDEPSTESETPIECEDGQECPADLESSTDRLKKSNKPIRKQLKPSNPRDIHKPKLPINCEEGEECPSETDSPIDRPKTGNKHIKKHKPKQPLGTIESPIKCAEGQECSQKPKSFTDQPKTISSMEDTSVVQQIVTEGSILSSIEHTTSDGEAVTEEILKDSTTNPPTTPADGLHGYIEESTTNFPTESTESSRSFTNEYTTTESERSTKHPTDYLQETTITSTGDNTDDEPFTENYTTIGARKNKINIKVLEESTTISPKIKQKSLKQPIEGKLHIRGNKQHRTETVEETTNPLISDEDCKDSDDCNSERCKGSASCSEEGKTSESCSNSSDGSSEECTEKSCEGPDCSVTTPSSSSSSSVECENSSEEKCSTESADSCADGNCSTATTSAPRTTPLPPPVNSRENSTESCSDSDCSTPESCEGESCSSDSKSSSKCEGPDCLTTTESCEDEDCSSNSKITDLKTTPRVEHMRSTGAMCDSADCLGETNEDCQGPDCEPTEQTTSLNCESGDCTSQHKTSCTGPNCPSRKSKTCNGDDCSQNCEGDECLNTNDNVTRPPITESPATFKRTLSPKPLNNENDKPKLCSTKDPHRKRKNERLQRVRQLSNSVPEEQISSIQDNELPSDKVNVRRSQNRKKVEEYIKPQLGPLLKGLTKATEINKLNKNIRNQRQFRRDKSLQTSQASVNKQLNHSYPYPAGLHTSLNTDSDLNLNAHRRSNNLQNQGKKSNNIGKMSRGQEYTIKPRQRNNNLNNSKISKMDHQFSARNNQRKQQTVGKSFDYFEYTSPPQLYQNKQKLFSKTKPVTI